MLTSQDHPLRCYRMETLRKLNSNFSFRAADIKEKSQLEQLLEPDVTHIIHLAAKAGVRESMKNPEAFLQVNIVGYFNLLELARLKGIKHFIYASSSSVYGKTQDIPFKRICNMQYPS